MSISKESFEVFHHGSTWVRADFHLHTSRDKEFKYTGEESYFVASYIEGLKRTSTKVGVTFPRLLHQGCGS
jgi:hypothetical protein